SASRLAEWLRKLIDDRLHLQCDARFPVQSRTLRQQRSQARSVWLHSFHLHFSRLGSQRRKPRGAYKRCPACCRRKMMPAKSESARSRISAGLLMFRHRNDQVEVLLAHPGGPLFARKDDGIWTIPKGEAAPKEDLLTRAQIEFEEEVG